jgi:hypothetical protein
VSRSNKLERPHHAITCALGRRPIEHLLVTRQPPGFMVGGTPEPCPSAGFSVYLAIGWRAWESSAQIIAIRACCACVAERSSACALSYRRGHESWAGCMIAQDRVLVAVPVRKLVACRCRCMPRPTSLASGPSHPALRPLGHRHHGRKRHEDYSQARHTHPGQSCRAGVVGRGIATATGAAGSMGRCLRGRRGQGAGQRRPVAGRHCRGRRPRRHAAA